MTGILKPCRSTTVRDPPPPSFPGSRCNQILQLFSARYIPGVLHLRTNLASRGPVVAHLPEFLRHKRAPSPRSLGLRRHVNLKVLKVPFRPLYRVHQGSYTFAHLAPGPRRLSPQNYRSCTSGTPPRRSPRLGPGGLVNVAPLSTVPRAGILRRRGGPRTSRSRRLAPLELPTAHVRFPGVPPARTLSSAPSSVALPPASRSSGPAPESLTGAPRVRSSARSRGPRFHAPGLTRGPAGHCHRGDGDRASLRSGPRRESRRAGKRGGARVRGGRQGGGRSEGGSRRRRGARAA